MTFAEKIAAGLGHALQAGIHHAHGDVSAMDEELRVAGEVIAAAVREEIDRAIASSRDQKPQEIDVVPCTCCVAGPDYHQTKTDPACPYHGENGTMVARIDVDRSRARGAPTRKMRADQPTRREP